MAAGLGFKTFTTGEVLTAADTNGYLMQGVLVFASSAARSAAITSPQEGQYSYLKDTNSTEYYDGAAWIAAPIGDITGVTAGTGISGGGTSGTVTITNSMATEIAAKGDLIVGTGAATFDNLTVGTNGQTLVADSAEATGLKWAAPTSGAMVYLTSAAFTTVSSVSLPTDTFTTTYDIYKIYLMLNGSSSATAVLTRMRVAGSDYTGSDYFWGGLSTAYNSSTTTYTNGSAQSYWGSNINNNIARSTIEITVQNPKVPAYSANVGWFVGMGDLMGATTQALWQNGPSTYDALTFIKASSGTFSGKYAVYGIAKS